MFMKWAKTKAMESCWGEENMKLYTLNMKKAVAKCNQVDAPELDLPPFRRLNSFVNKMVYMADHKEDQHDDMKMMMKMMMFMTMMRGFNQGSSYGRHKCAHGNCKDQYEYENEYDNKNDDMMEKMRMMMMMKKMMGGDGYSEFEAESRHDQDSMPEMFFKMFKKNNEYNDYNDYQRSDNYENKYEKMPMFRKMMSSMRFKRQADDSLALNDRLKEKLEGVMTEHMSYLSNMTCVMREMNMIDNNNNIDVAAMKAEANNKYKMPSEWFKQRYFTILDSCYEVAQNLPSDLDNEYDIQGDKSLRNIGKIKSFMSCCKSAKMKLCMNQDTKKKIETNFGPVEELLSSFNNQINEEQLFYMVNELLQGAEDDMMV